MGPLSRAAVLGGLCLCAPLAAPAAAQPEDAAEVIVERLHSPVPLYTFDWEDLWPRSYSSGDEFGCSSRVPFGDWYFAPAPANQDEDGHWRRFSNYGVFHCAAILRAGDDRTELEDSRFEYGFFVKLGNAKVDSAKWEIWALQSGTVPGSDYVLLAREAGQKGQIESFRMLQQRCPAGSILKAEGLDIWSTRYCSIESREKLLSLARKMLRLPPRGTLSRVPSQLK
jgi:hypothetical protein